MCTFTIAKISAFEKEGDEFILLSDFGSNFFDDEDNNINDDYDEDFPGSWNLPTTDM